jgi:hypothetical protein
MFLLYSYLVDFLLSSVLIYLKNLEDRCLAWTPFKYLGPILVTILLYLHHLQN